MFGSGELSHGPNSGRPPTGTRLKYRYCSTRGTCFSIQCIRLSEHHSLMMLSEEDGGAYAGGVARAGGRAVRRLVEELAHSLTEFSCAAVTELGTRLPGKLGTCRPRIRSLAIKAATFPVRSFRRT